MIKMTRSKSLSHVLTVSGFGYGFNVGQLRQTSAQLPQSLEHFQAHIISKWHRGLFHCDCEPCFGLVNMLHLKKRGLAFRLSYEGNVS